MCWPMTRAVLLTLALFLPALALAQPTWSKEVSRIVQAKCEGCHRPGDIAPFSLTNYDEVSTWAQDIKRVVTDRSMPPWKPVAGNFRDFWGLTDEERKTILDWIEAGTPQGDPADLPEPLARSGPWPLGEPDLVLEMPEPFEVTRGRDIYRCFLLSPNLEEDKWISAVQVLPGNRQVVHHVVLFTDDSGQAEKLDAAEEGPGYTCFGGPGFDVNITNLSTLDLLGGSWAPGMRARHLPEGIGMFLSRKSKIVMQVHYFPSGPPGLDRSKIGLYFTKPGKKLRFVPLMNTTFRIPPGEEKTVTQQLTIPLFMDAQAVVIAPHMHLIGRKIKVELERRNEITELIRIDDWDFNWQSFYTFAEPVDLRPGDRLKLTCTFDNSDKNPRNPFNPPQEVRWGEGTRDEMCLAFIGTVFKFDVFPFTGQGQPMLK